MNVRIKSMSLRATYKLISPAEQGLAYLQLEFHKRTGKTIELNLLLSRKSAAQGIGFVKSWARK